jgi:hypothetical protein
MNKPFIEYMWREHRRVFEQYMQYGGSLMGSRESEETIVL